MVSEVRSGWQEALAGGMDACSRHDYAQGKDFFSKALEEAHKENAPEHSVGEIFFNLGWCHQALGEVALAEQRYKQALNTMERCYGQGSESAVKVLEQISALFRGAGRNVEADEFALRARSSPQMGGGAPAQSAPSSANVPEYSESASPAQLPQSPAHSEASAPPHAVPGSPGAGIPLTNAASATGASGQSPARPEPQKESRAGIVMEGLPVAKKQGGFVAGSMFKDQAKPGSNVQAEVASSHNPFASSASASTAVEEEQESFRERNMSLPVQAKRKLPRSLATATGAADDPGYDDFVTESGVYQEPVDIESLIHPKEKIYGRISGGYGCFIYFLAAISFIGLIAAPLILLASFISQGLYLGNLRARGIRVSPRQFPEIHRLLEKYCTILKMEIPEVLVVNEDGLLNAFANRLHRRDMIVICSDVLELAYEQGEKELAFVVVHELAHVKLGHVKWKWLHIPGYIIPFLGNAYSRACEYSCDRIARQMVPDGALFGLVALAAGTKLYRNVNLTALYEQAEHDWGFWTWFHEIQSSHPNLLNRIRAIGLKDAEVKRRLRGRDA
jgi:Zn-dependent protease with chaperone function